MTESDSSKKSGITKNNHAKHLFPSGFDPVQIRILQKRLKKYWKVEDISFVEIAGEIEDYTNVIIGDDTIKRFIERLTTTPRPGEQKSTSKRVLHAIASFLLHEKILYLDITHLKRRKIPTNAPIGFVNALAYDLDYEALVLHESFAGIYRTIIKESASNYTEYLEIDTSKKMPFYDVKVTFVPSNKQIKKRNDHSFKKEIRFVGWGIITPENNIFIHVKEVKHGRNNFWTSIVSPLDFASDRTTEYIFLSRQQDSYTLDENDVHLLEHKQQSVTEITKRGVLFNDQNTHELQLIRNQTCNIHDEYDIVDLDRISTEKDSPLDSDKADSPFLKSFRLSQPQKVLPSETFVTREVRMVSQKELGMRLLNAAHNYETEAIEKLLAAGAPVNYIHPASGATALHYTATFGDRDSIRVLIRHPDIDYLIEDRQGRTASELAYVAAQDIAVERLLFIKESKQRKTLSDLNTKPEGTPFDPEI